MRCRHDEAMSTLPLIDKGSIYFCRCNGDALVEISLWVQMHNSTSRTRVWTDYSTKEQERTEENKLGKTAPSMGDTNYRENECWFMGNGVRRWRLFSKPWEDIEEELFTSSSLFSFFAAHKQAKFLKSTISFFRQCGLILRVQWENKLNQNYLPN